jgi:hypothetical protein
VDAHHLKKTDGTSSSPQMKRPAQNKGERSCAGLRGDRRSYYAKPILLFVVGGHPT